MMVSTRSAVLMRQATVSSCDRENEFRAVGIVLNLGGHETSRAIFD